MQRPQRKLVRLVTPAVARVALLSARVIPKTEWQQLQQSVRYVGTCVLTILCYSMIVILLVLIFYNDFLSAHGKPWLRHTLLLLFSLLQAKKAESEAKKAAKAAKEAREQAKQSKK